jgi:type IV secretion system protein TrbL
MRESFAAGGRAVTGGSAPGSGASGQPEGSGPPDWARRMKRNQTISHGVGAAHQAIRSGDHPSSGGGINLSEGE